MRKGRVWMVIEMTSSVYLKCFIGSLTLSLIYITICYGRKVDTFEFEQEYEPNLHNYIDSFLKWGLLNTHQAYGISHDIVDDVQEDGNQHEETRGHLVHDPGEDTVSKTKRQGNNHFPRLGKRKMVGRSDKIYSTNALDSISNLRLYQLTRDNLVYRNTKTNGEI